MCLKLGSALSEHTAACFAPMWQNNQELKGKLLFSCFTVTFSKRLDGLKLIMSIWKSERILFQITIALQHGRHKKTKKNSASSCFQHLSAKFALFWFWSHPIIKLETDIQKWLWPELITMMTSPPDNKVDWNVKRRNSTYFHTICNFQCFVVGQCVCIFHVRHT